MECIQMGSMQEMFGALQKMVELQRTHNEVKRDLENLLNLASNNEHNPDVLTPLIRSCIKELFGLIEADIYLLNQFNPYTGYNDRDSLVTKFKKTYKHHSAIFKKTTENNRFQSTFYRRLWQLKIKRDEITHPKSFQSLKVSLTDLNETRWAFKEYCDYISSLMTNVGVSTTIPFQ